MSTEDVTAEIAAVLAEHDGWSQTGPHDKEDRFDLVCYGCGDLLFPGIPDEFGEARMDELHRHHLADLLAARDRRVRAEALAEVADARRCGGCKGQGSHRRHCPRHPTYHPWIPLADAAESIGDSVGEPGLANRAWALAGAIRDEMPSHPYRPIRLRREANA